MFQVYCDMETNGGGYTFLPREFLASLTKPETQHISLHIPDVLIRVNTTTGQKYAILEQLSGYRLVLKQLFKYRLMLKQLFENMSVLKQLPK